MYRSEEIGSWALSVSTQGAEIVVTRCLVEPDADEPKPFETEWYLVQIKYDGEHGKSRVIVAVVDTLQDALLRADLIKECSSIHHDTMRMTAKAVKKILDKRIL